MHTKCCFSELCGVLVCDEWALQVKLASARYLDNLPTTGDENGRAFRDLEAEARVLQVQGCAFVPKACESCSDPLCFFALFALV